MTDWVRLWHDMPTDPKWRVIARKSGQRLPCVIAVFNLMMVNASGNAAERGQLVAWDDEDAAAALDMETEEVTAIREAMQGKVLDGNRLTGWERRQPKREDNAAKRTQEYRERKKAVMPCDAPVTQCDAPEAETDADTEELSPNGDCPSADEPPFTIEQVFEGYQDLARSLALTVPRDLTPERRQLLKARRNQYSFEDHLEVFAKCRGSPFLRGERGRGSPLCIDWLFKKTNFQKVLEGNYDG